MSRNGKNRPRIWVAKGKLPDTFYTRSSNPAFPAGLVGIPVKMPCGCRPVRAACTFVNYDIDDRLNLTCKTCNATRHAFIDWKGREVSYV